MKKKWKARPMYHVSYWFKQHHFELDKPIYMNLTFKGYPMEQLMERKKEWCSLNTK